MLQADSGKAATKDAAIGADCVAHARMFSNRPDFDLASAQPQRFLAQPVGSHSMAVRNPVNGSGPKFAAVREGLCYLNRRWLKRRPSSSTSKGSTIPVPDRETALDHVAEQQTTGARCAWSIGNLQGLPAPLQTLPKGWFAKYYLKPRAALPEVAARIADASGL